VGAKRAPSGKSSSVAGTANVHTPAQGIPAVAAVIEIALSAQPMAGQTWRRRKDWLSEPLNLKPIPLTCIARRLVPQAPSTLMPSVHDTDTQIAGLLGPGG
jgi:hypothetical protein